MIAVLLVLAPLAGFSQLIRLNYQPKGVVIHIKLDGTNFYTDTSALLSIYKPAKKGHIAYSAAVRAHLRAAVQKSNADTISFEGEFIPFKEEMIDSESKGWHVRYAVTELINKRKVVIYDKAGHHVPRIEKAIKDQTDTHITFAYISTTCGDLILEQTLLYRKSSLEIRRL